VTADAAAPEGEPFRAPEYSVLVMTYNERASLEAVARELDEALRRLARPYEVVIIDDGSTDGSGALADRLAAENPSVRVLHHKANQGLGGVYRTGFAEARGRFVSFFSADGQFPADIVAQFAREIDGADLVLGYLPSRDCPWIAQALSMIEKLVYGALFGPLPKFQGVLMFRRALLVGMPLKSKGRDWVVLMEFILRAQRLGCRIKSVPTGLRPRKSGESKVTNLRTVWNNFQGVLRLRLDF
jgi:glycosyltransferase involved in cell wall biosynthesis